MSINDAFLKAIKEDRISEYHFKSPDIAKFLSRNVSGMFYGGVDKNICYVDGVAIMKFEDE